MEQLVVGGAGAVMGLLAVAVWNRMPARWLCDYGEAESEIHRERKLAALPWGVVFAAGFAVCGIYAYRCTADQAGEWGGFAAVFFELTTLWLLSLIFMVDWKYRIIPDQFVLALIGLGLFVTAIGEVLVVSAFPVIGRPMEMRLFTRILSGVVCGGGFLLLGSTAYLFSHWHELLMLEWKRQATPEVMSKPERKREAMPEVMSEVMPEPERGQGFGMGDVKLLFALGVLFGMRGGLFVLCFASLFCGLCLGVLAVLGHASMKEEHPFGPYLCLTAAIWVVCIR